MEWVEVLTMQAEDLAEARDAALEEYGDMVAKVATTTPEDAPTLGQRLIAKWFDYRDLCEQADEAKALADDCEQLLARHAELRQQVYDVAASVARRYWAETFDIHVGTLLMWEGEMWQVASFVGYVAGRTRETLPSTSSAMLTNVLTRKTRAVHAFQVGEEVNILLSPTAPDTIHDEHEYLAAAQAVCMAYLMPDEFHEVGLPDSQLCVRFDPDTKRVLVVDEGAHYHGPGTAGTNMAYTHPGDAVRWLYRRSVGMA